MLRITVQNLLARKRRLISLFFAVVLGVSFLSGNLVLTNTIKHTFADLFADVNRGTDAFVRNATKIDMGFGGEVRGRIDERLVEPVKRVPGVKAAEGLVQGYGQIVAKNGKALGDPAMGAPTFAGSWAAAPELNAFRLVSGREPRRDGDVVIDRKSARDGKLAVGDTTKLLTASGPIQVDVVGVAKFGTADSPGGASFALMTLPAAQKYVARTGQLDGIAVVGARGVSQRELANRIQRVLPAGTEAITGAKLTKESQDSIEEGLSTFVNFLLLPFAVVAVLVSVFSIYNTFSILVAQRSREMALLRALGATRRQVLTSVVGEALVVGFFASIVGLFGGLAVAGALKGVLKGFGFDIPATGLTLRMSTVITAFVVGMGATALTSLVPAIKASRVPPLAAMRDVALERTDVSRARIVIGVILTLLGALNFISGVITKGNAGLSRIGLGALVLILALVILGPILARPIAGFIGAPLPRLRGVAGKLAKDNATRNPRRTSGTAAALMIGVAVVAIFTIFAASIKQSVDRQLAKSFAGDLVIDAQTRGFGGFNPKLAADISKLPEVEAASGLRIGAVKIDAKSHLLIVVDPRMVAKVFDVGIREGSLRNLDARHLAVSTRYAEEHDWKVGHAVTATFPDGVTEPFEVGALFANRDVVSSDFVMSTDAWSRHATDDVDALVIVKLSRGVPIAKGKVAVQRVARAYPTAKVQDRKAYGKTVAAQVNQLLGFVYVMLALAIVIAIMGIANTLSLSIHERRRELGLLRAIGETRRQVRSMVRWESVIIAVFGSVGGLALGVLSGWALVTAASDTGFATFAFPAGSLIILLVLGGLAGVVAALRPASRAAKLDLLEAIATG